MTDSLFPDPSTNFPDDITTTPIDAHVDAPIDDALDAQCPPEGQTMPPATTGEPAYLSGLNPEQRAAVDATEGPVLVLAGAGTGKTRVLTTRLAHILATRRAAPWQILAVTFTNKAAREMRERLANLIGPGAEGLPWLGTFHAIGVKILRQHAELVGLKPGFSILDTDDQIRLLKQVIAADGLDEKRWPARLLASIIDGWKNKGFTPKDVPEEDKWAFADGRGAALYATYQERLKVLNAVDFGDLLLLNLALLRDNPDILRKYHNTFRYMLVDEYQDTNTVQYLWLRLLAQGNHNICCVGDDDQAIYGWRGADVDNILKFENEFSDATVIRLERNYRSTGHILGAAHGIISTNQARLGKTLWTDDDAGERVRVRGVWDGEAEARLVAEEIENWRSKGRPYTECAVLVRAAWQMRAFEDRFIMLGLPYRVVGGPRFFERAEVRDANAYFRLVRSPDDDLAFERIINTPKRGIGASTVQKLQMAARAQGISLTRATEMMTQTDEIRGKARTALRVFLRDMERWRTLAQTKRHDELAEIVLDESGYTTMWREDKSPQAAGRLDNLKEVIRAMSGYDSMEAYLEHVALVAEREAAAGEEDDELWLMTLHAAKGLEFPYVFLPGWEEEVFPSKRSLDEKGNAALEEERRLAYVGVTRARERAQISFAANRQIYGRWQSVLPSRFIDELPAEHIDAESETGFYGASNAGYGELAEPVNPHNSSYSSPGWKRYQAAHGKKRQSPPVIEGRAELIAREDTSAGMARGTRVFHIKFGYGNVLRADGNKVEVDFDKAGIKKVIDSFLEVQ